MNLWWLASARSHEPLRTPQKACPFFRDGLESNRATPSHGRRIQDLQTSMPKAVAEYEKAKGRIVPSATRRTSSEAAPEP